MEADAGILLDELGLKPGQVSPPIVLKDSIRILKLVAREAAGQRGVNDPQVQQTIRDTLRDRIALDREVAALSSQARASAAVLVVAAAGNDFEEANTPQYPAVLLQPLGSNGRGGIGIVVVVMGLSFAKKINRCKQNAGQNQRTTGSNTPISSASRRTGRST